jgi:uncharacterized membrane protein
VSTPIDKEIEEGKIFAIAAYWAFLCILPFILKKDNKFAVYHGKQGLVLFIFLAGGFLFNIIPFLGQIIWRLVVFAYIALSLLGTLQALKGTCGHLPVISNLAKKIDL